MMSNTGQSIIGLNALCAGALTVITASIALEQTENFAAAWDLGCGFES